jgi:hypothetical protein
MVGSVEAENAAKARYKLYLQIVDAYPAIHRPTTPTADNCWLTHERKPYRIRITDIRVRVGRSSVWYREEWKP